MASSSSLAESLAELHGLYAALGIPPQLLDAAARAAVAADASAAVPSVLGLQPAFSGASTRRPSSGPGLVPEPLPSLSHGSSLALGLSALGSGPSRRSSGADGAPPARPLLSAAGGSRVVPPSTGSVGFGRRQSSRDGVDGGVGLGTPPRLGSSVGQVPVVGPAPAARLPGLFVSHIALADLASPPVAATPSTARAEGAGARDGSWSDVSLALSRAAEAVAVAAAGSLAPRTEVGLEASPASLGRPSAAAPTQAVRAAPAPADTAAPIGVQRGAVAVALPVREAAALPGSVALGRRRPSLSRSSVAVTMLPVPAARVGSIGADCGQRNRQALSSAQIFDREQRAVVLRADISLLAGGSSLLASSGVSSGVRVGSIDVRRCDTGIEAAFGLSHRFIARYASLGMVAEHAPSIAKAIADSLPSVLLAERALEVGQRRRSNAGLAASFRGKTTTTVPFDLSTEARGKAAAETSVLSEVPIVVRSTAGSGDGVGRSVSRGAGAALLQSILGGEPRSSPVGQQQPLESFFSPAQHTPGASRRRGRLLGRLHVEIAPGKAGAIAMHEGESAALLVDNFARIYQVRDHILDGVLAAVEARIAEGAAPSSAQASQDEQAAASSGARAALQSTTQARGRPVAVLSPSTTVLRQAPSRIIGASEAFSTILPAAPAVIPRATTLGARPHVNLWFDDDAAGAGRAAPAEAAARVDEPTARRKSITLASQEAGVKRLSAAVHVRARSQPRQSELQPLVRGQARVRPGSGIAQPPREASPSPPQARETADYRRPRSASHDSTTRHRTSSAAHAAIVEVLGSPSAAEHPADRSSVRRRVYQVDGPSSGPAAPLPTPISPGRARNKPSAKASPVLSPVRPGQLEASPAGPTALRTTQYVFPAPAADWLAGSSDADGSDGEDDLVGESLLEGESADGSEGEEEDGEVEEDDDASRVSLTSAQQRLLAATLTPAPAKRSAPEVRRPSVKTAEELQASLGYQLPPPPPPPAALTPHSRKGSTTAGPADPAKAAADPSEPSPAEPTGKALFVLEVELGGGKPKGRIIVRAGAEPMAMATAFLTEYGLPAALTPRLVGLINGVIAAQQAK
jgi:hypothetical protein